MSEITAKQLEKLLKNASEEMMDAVQEGLLMGAELAVGALDESTKRNLNKHGKSKKRSRSSVSGSSGLAGSWKAVFIGSSTSIAEVGAYSHLPYAGIHEGGDTIRAKTKLLTIPLTDAARDYGAREFPQKLDFVPRGPRSKAGDNIVGVLAFSEETGDPKDPIKLTPQYALAKSVEIPATHYISEAASGIEDEVAEVLRDTIVRDVIKPLARGL